jgi:HSP20 family protein
MPGLEADDIEVTYHKGQLWLRGSKKEEEKDKKKKYYRYASSSFNYRLAVPGNIDEKVEPDAEYKNGVMKVTFKKMSEAQPKKITIKKS